MTCNKIDEQEVLKCVHEWTHTYVQEEMESSARMLVYCKKCGIEWLKTDLPFSTSGN